MKGISRTFPSRDFKWWNPTKILLGNGKVRELADELSLDVNFHGKTKCWVVTEAEVKNAGLLDYLLESLNVRSLNVVGVSDDPIGEAAWSRISEIVRLARKQKPDFWIALGGGSVMASCKAAAVLESNGGELNDYFGENLVEKETKPIICIPTTAGTGSEVSSQTLIMDGRTKKKRMWMMSDYRFIPKIAILDSELTRTLPAHLVAATGLHALFNAISALTSKYSQELSTPISLKAIEILVNNLVEAFQNNASNQDVRSKMLLAATMGGIVSQSIPPGVEQSIGNTAACLYGLHYGLAISIARLHVMEYNMKALAPIYATLARAIGVKDEGLSDESLGLKAIEKLRELYTKVDVKLTYKEYGTPIDHDSIENFIMQSLDEDQGRSNPTKIGRTPKFEKLVRNCIGV